MAQSLEQKIEKRWPVKTRKVDYGKVATGYMLNQSNPYELLPDPEIISVLEEAFDLLESGHSTRNVTPWFNERVDINITFQTLNNLYNRHRKPFVNYKNNRKKLDSANSEGKVYKSAIKKRQAKRKLNEAAKKYNEIIEKEREKKVQAELAKNPKTQKIDLTSIGSKEETPPDPSVNVVFSPNPGPQTEFLASSEQEVLYGGAAGGGKSYALLADPMRYFNKASFAGLLIRRTNDELRELKQKSKELYPKAFPQAKWSEKESSWKFPSGATLWMTYLERDDDVHRYQGQAYCWIAFDELTQYPTPYAWNYLRSRLRSADPTMPLFQRGTANPGGPGHHWVKKMFIDPAPPNKAFYARDDETGEVILVPEKDGKGRPHPRAGQPLFQRKFIPASLYDNPYLTQDGSYEMNLMSLPEEQRQRLLYGDWNVVAGAAFPEFNLHTHTCDPFKIPAHWNKFRACDFGYSSNSAVLWIAVDPEFGTLYVYREYYVSKQTASELGANIRRIEFESGERVSYGVLDSSTWHQRGNRGPTIAEDIIREGVPMRPSDRSAGSRIAGRNRLHQLLRVDDKIEKPGIIIFNTCRQLITDLQSIPSDPKGGEDIDDKYPSDHTYDALRYGITSRPAPYSPFDTITQMTDEYKPVNATFGY